MRSEFGPDSTNPRMRRAFAHTQLVNFRKGIATFKETREAIDSAQYTKKGQGSGFEFAAVKAVAEKSEGETVVFLDWTGGTTDTPRFGGYLMSKVDGALWEQNHRAAVVHHEFERYNAIFDAGYPQVWLATTPDQKDNFVWGTAYPLDTNPAKAHVEQYQDSR